MNRERRDLLTACRIHGLDSGCLHRRAKMMLGFRHKREAYKGMYDRGRMAQELRKALYCIHNLEVEDMEALTGAFAILSGSGMLDDIIEEAIDTAVSRFVIGEKIGSNVGAVRSHGVVSQATKGNHLFIVF